MKQIHRSYDFNGNRIVNALASDIEDTSDDNAIANKKYVEQSVTLNDDIVEQVQSTTVTVGGITAGTNVKNKTIKEVISDILFKRVLPTYQLPVMTFNVLPSGASMKTEVGSSDTITLQSLVTLNDSAGLEVNGYYFDGTSISNPVRISQNQLSVNAVMRPSNVWNAKVYYTAPGTIKQDSLGTSHPELIFANGVLTKSYTHIAYWPIYYGSVNGNVNMPTANSVHATGTGLNKALNSVSAKYSVQILAGNERTVFYIIPMDVTSYIVRKDGITINQAVSVSKMNVSDAFNSGQTNTYTVFRHHTGSVLGHDSIYELEILNL